MGLLDWITEGVGSSMGGSSMPPDMAGAPDAMPPDLPPQGGMTVNGQPVPTHQISREEFNGSPPPQAQPPLSFQRPEFARPAPMPPGGDPMTAGGNVPNGPGLPPPPTQPVPMPSPRPAAAGMPPLPPAAPSGPGIPPVSPPLSRDDAGGAMQSYANAGGQAFTPGAPTSLAPDNPGSNAGPATGLIGRALGLDANRERSVRGALGAGLKAAGENANKPGLAAFAGSMGSGLEGGQNATDKGYDQRLKALQLAVTAQAAGDKAAYNKNYAEYLKGKLSADAAKATPGARGAWNKPDSQKFIDAQNALSRDPEIRASEKMLANGTGNMEQHNALIAKKQQMYLSGVGLSPQAVQTFMGNPPGTQKNPHQVTTQQDFDTYVKPGQHYIVPSGPHKGEVYIRKGEGATPQAESPPAAETPIAPPGPMPGSHEGGTDAEDPENGV